MSREGFVAQRHGEAGAALSGLTSVAAPREASPSLVLHAAAHFSIDSSTAVDTLLIFVSQLLFLYPLPCPSEMIAICSVQLGYV